MRSVPKLLVVILSIPVFAAEGRNVVDDMVDVEHQRVWNRFAVQVVELHRAQLTRHAVRIEMRFGEYGGETGKGHHFRETTHFDADNGRLLSRVRTNRNDPDEIQIVDVYVYDDAGRVLRDYSFTYLPWGRAAPLQTLIHLHSYPDELHAYRQFDASGNLLFESCEGVLSGRQVRISVWEEDLGKTAKDAEAYRNCFAKLPVTAGSFLTPQ